MLRFEYWIKLSWIQQGERMANRQRAPEQSTQTFVFSFAVRWAKSWAANRIMRYRAARSSRPTLFFIAPGFDHFYEGSAYFKYLREPSLILDWRGGSLQNIQVSRGKRSRFLKSNHFQASERVRSDDVAFQAHAFAEDWVAVRSRSGGHSLFNKSVIIRRCVRADAVPRPPVALNILSCFLLSSLTHQTTESFPLLKARNQILFRKLPSLPSFRCYRRCW